ncbi:GMC oxidoreductase protein [Rutstroemia sp. NJR-2017a BVV2]|nr:GMC oxidoreductase protein [Rutstroemia sp. NJR-2017a BVV2]
MVFKTPSLVLLAVLFCESAFSLRLGHRDLNAVFLPCYDYIIAGGGVSGLVVANRLSEDPTGAILYIFHFYLLLISVLVIEAGEIDKGEDFIRYPFDEGDGLDTSYDWNLWTAPQTFLDGASRPFDLGKGVGGGSLINGMCWTRGGTADYDAWVALGNPGWGWDDMLPYFKKTETYTDDVDAEFSRDLYIHPNLSTHGTTGYINVSYPKYFYPQSKIFLDGLRELGIPILTDPNNGTTAGGMLIPNNISPDNQTRSDARRGYLDGFIGRPNLHVVTGFMVIRVLIDSTPEVLGRDLPDGQFITGVQIAPTLSTVVREISCSREVILAAGNAHTPQILELSGIGQPEVLQKFELPVHINLPGVGENFQDHPYVGAIHYYGDRRLMTQAQQEYYINKTGPWTAGAINTVAFPSLAQITPNWAERVADAMSQAASEHLTPGLDQSVISGYAAQKDIITNQISRADSSVCELLNDNVGLLSVAAMHPLSRGSIHITTDNPYVPPEIDPRYCSNPLDLQILTDALIFNNKLLNTNSMQLLQPVSYYPYLPNATAEILMTAIRSGLRTEFHGSGATSMMPRELGGVVDPDLRVYGTKNLRIVDAGIIPMLPASHLQAPVYAIAEKAADLIKRDNYGLTPNGCGKNSTYARPGPPLPSTSSSTVQSAAASSSTSFSRIEEPNSQHFPNLGSPAFRQLPNISVAQAEKVSTRPLVPIVESPVFRNDSSVGLTSNEPRIPKKNTPTPESAPSAIESHLQTATFLNVTTINLSSPQLPTTSQNALANVAAVFGGKARNPAETLVPAIPVAGEDTPKPVITAPPSVLDLVPAEAQMFNAIRDTPAISMVASMLEIKYAAAAPTVLEG